MNAKNTTATNTTTPNTTVRAPLDVDLAEDLAAALGLVEDWLLHASPETLDELTEFAYGPPVPDGEHDHRRLQPIIDLLGEAAIRLRPARQDRPAGQATTVPGPSR